MKKDILDEVLTEFGWRSKRGYPLLDKDNNFIDGEDVKLFEDIMSSFEEARLPIEEEVIDEEVSGKELPGRFSILRKLLPKFTATNALGVRGSEERKKFNEFFGSMISGNSIEDNIKSLIKRLNEVEEGANIIDNTKNLVMLETIDSIFRDLNAQQAGYTMESLMSFIIGGKGVGLNTTGETGKETSIVDFKKGSKLYGLKTILPNTEIDGSIELLVKEILNVENGEITYIIIHKEMSGKGGVKGLNFYKVLINKETYWKMLTPGSIKNIENYFRENKIKIPKSNIIREVDEEFLNEGEDKTRFYISKKVLKDSFIGKLDLDRSFIMKLYKDSLEKIEEKITNIYKSLNDFETTLINYLSSDRKERESKGLGDKLIDDSKKIPEETSKSKLGDL